MELQFRKVIFIADCNEGNDVVRPDWKPSLASIRRAFLMLLTFRVIFCKAGLLLTLKLSTWRSWSIPVNEDSPVLVMRMLEACVTPSEPKDNCCNAGRAVKLSWLICSIWGMLNDENTVKLPNWIPLMDLRLPKDSEDNVPALLMVKFPTIFSTPSIESCVCPLPLAASEISVGMVIEPLYVVQDATCDASAAAVTVKVAELLQDWP